MFFAAAALALASQTRADVNYNLGKEQAKRAANQNNADPGVPAAPPSSPAPPADPALAATHRNLADLHADLDALNQVGDAPAPADQRAALMTHLAAAAADKKPALASIRKLAGHLMAATGGKTNLTAQNAKLAWAIHAFFNGGQLSASQQQILLEGVRKILSDAGVVAGDVDDVIGDLKQVAAETQ